MTRRELIGALPVFAAEVDRRDHLLWLNDHAEKANNTTTADLAGSLLMDLWPEDESLTATRWAVRRDGHPRHTLTPVSLLTGERVWWEATILPAGAGKLHLVSTDVTAKVKLASQQALRRLLLEPDRSPTPAILNDVAALAVLGHTSHEIAMALGVHLDVVVASLARLGR